MNTHNHAQQNRPSQKGPDPPPVLLLIKQHPDRDAAQDLSDPIDGIVQGATLDIKQDSVVFAELPGIEVIAGEEHGKEEDDEWVLSEYYPETFELGFPRGVSGSGNPGTVGPDHFVWFRHYERDYDPHDGQDEEGDLGKGQRRLSVHIGGNRSHLHKCLL